MKIFRERKTFRDRVSFYDGEYFHYLDSPDEAAVGLHDLVHLGG